MNEPEIIVFADQAAGAIEAAGRVAASLADAVTARGRADWATTGGSTPVAIYRRLAARPLVNAVPWADIHVWWGDDRYVPRDHPLSNVKPFEDVLLDVSDAEEGTAGAGYAGVPLPAENVHPFRTGEAIGRGAGAAWCAAALADELRAAGLPEQDGWPVFDIMLLGIGPDGHILSVFPGSSALGRFRAGAGDPGPDARRAACRTGHAQPGGHRRRPAGDRGRQWRREGCGRRRHPRAGAGSAAMARRAGSARGCGLDPR